MGSPLWRNSVSLQKENTNIISNGLLNPSPRDVIEAKMALKAHNEVAHCSFQPRLIARNEDRNAIKVIIPNRWDHLYKDAINRRAHILARKGDDHTFKPTLSKKANLMVRDRKSSESIDSLFLAVGSGRQPPREEVQESFIPTVNKRPGSDNRLSPTEASERLYASRDKHKLDTERKIAELEDRVALECPFSPTLSPKSKNGGERSTGSPKNAYDSVVNRLLLFGQRSHEKLALETSARNEQAMMGVTFQPSLFTPQKKSSYSVMRSRSVDSSPRAVSPPGNRFDHLYQDAIKRQADELEGRYDNSDLTFQPNISPLANKIPSTRKSSEMINSLHSAIGSGRVVITPQKRDDNSYKPSISKLGQKLNRSTSLGNVSDRLYDAKDIQKVKLDTLKLTAAVKLAEECTFSPEINDKSRNLVLSEDDVVDRLLEYGEIKKKKLIVDTAARAEIDNLHVTFSPKIIESPRRSENNVMNIENKNENNQFDRLYSDAIKRHIEDLSVRSRANENDSQLTFQPVISNLAKSLNQSTLKDINDRQIESSIKRKDSNEAIRLLENNHPFAPSLSPMANKIENSQLNSINTHQKELSEKRRDNIINTRDEENTFSPKLIPCKKLKSPRVSIILDNNSFSLPSSPLCNSNNEISPKFVRSDSPLAKLDIVPPYTEMDRDVTDVEIIETPTTSEDSPTNFQNSGENIPATTKNIAENVPDVFEDFSKNVTAVFENISGNILKSELTAAARD